MKKLNKGFTLAEVLIVIAIIGTVAVLTLPTLNINVQKQQIGPALAKAINTLESANTLALQTEGVRLLNQLPNANNGAYFQALKSFVAYTYVGAVERTYTGVTFGDTAQIYRTKDGIDFIYANAAPVALQNVTTLPLSFSGNYYNNVYIDVNGNNKGPNIVGRDLYKVIVDTKGTVIPYGGEVYAQYVGGSVLWKDNNNCDSPQAKLTDAAACTGSVVDNGYKVIHF